MLLKKLVPVITIDGPSGTGKSVICKEISKRLCWNVLESGLIYRILAFIVFKNNIFISKNNFNFIFNNLNFCKLIKLINSKHARIKTYFFNDINHEYIGNLASKLACIPYIRNFLLLQQRLCRQFPGLIANGRDMGTVVFPDASIKFFIQSDLKVRAKRRLLEYQQKGIKFCDYQTIFLTMQERDNRDYNRKISPLVPAKNAILIDSTYMNLKQVVDTLMTYIFYNKNIRA